MKNIAAIEAPSILGLRPGGVEKLPEALKAHGFLNKLRTVHTDRVTPPPYNPQRDTKTKVLNPESIRYFSVNLAEAVQQQLEQDRFSLVLGGDCSIIIGCLLGLRRCGRYGLFFIDGHADFYQPEASPTGEVADMDLAIVTGRGPEVLTNIEGLQPLVRDEDVVAFGYRDADEQERYGSQDIRATGIHALDLPQIKQIGLHRALTAACRKILANDIDGFWIHLDVDVLDDAIMPAVEYRMAGGLSFDELSQTLSTLLATQEAVGMSIAIFNPTLDKDGTIAKAFVKSLVKGFRGAKFGGDTRGAVKNMDGRKTIRGKGWKRNTSISLEKYGIISKALLKVLTKKPMEFGVLLEKVTKEVKSFPGSVGWYTLSVLRELESEGKVVRTKGRPVTYHKK